MTDTPRSLKNCCVDYFCDKIDAICQTQTSVDGQVRRVLSTDDEFRLPSNIAEELIVALSSKREIEDWMLMLFDSEITGLRNVRLRKVSKLTLTGLRTLRSHRISNLEVTGLMNVSVNDLICCFGDWTLQNLQTLNVANSTLFDNAGNFELVDCLTKLRNLRTLNVSDTSFNDQGLKIVVRNLTKLENLDISAGSCWRVVDITQLRKCANRLKSLNMADNVWLGCTKQDIDVICDLHHLRHLDLSDDWGCRGLSLLLDGFREYRQDRVKELLKRPSCLPFLSSLEISGIETIITVDFRCNSAHGFKYQITTPVDDSVMVISNMEYYLLLICCVKRNFLVQHPRISFLGLVHTNACNDAMFTDSKHELYNPDLVVAGTANETQILEALRRYPNRDFLFQKALECVFQLTQDYEEPRVDVISLILLGMEAHPKCSGLQVNATACLYYLCREEFCQKIHPHWLKRIVKLTVTAMENFPTNAQIHMNALSTLYTSYRILEDVTFDAYRCVRVTMDALCQFDNESIKRMSVFISSTLAVKMSPEERSRIGTQTRYIIKLLSIVESKMVEGVMDITTRFTLNALWNLTNESPETCRVFLNEGGLDLYLKLIAKYKSQSVIENKVLGLMLNIAEVKKLRHALMTENFLIVVGSLLQSSEIDVSYFAAGIIAHLASDEERAWTVPTVSRAEVLSDVETTVLGWKIPTSELLSYSSFKALFPLISCHDTKAVQLWAVWSVHHVCILNPKRYCPMLLEEGGVKMLHGMMPRSEISKKVKELCRQILGIVRNEGLLFNFEKSLL